ncbi:hypothetical protein ACQ4P5_20380 [Ralstonia sp. L16]|uniref:hypothetical protein n=1 Tax=Ralstonia sp. L16 TaxID=3423950 RepID=UPI003F79AB6E
MGVFDPPGTPTPYEWIENWAREKGGTEAVRAGIANGIFGGRRKEAAQQWLARKDAEAQGKLDARAVEATESQAASAQRAVWISGAALVVSIIALLVAIASLFKP